MAIFYVRKDIETGEIYYSITRGSGIDRIVEFDWDDPLLEQYLLLEDIGLDAFMLEDGTILELEQ